MARVKIVGRLATGVGQATGFTKLDWVRAAFREHLGIDPYPGTINLLLDGEASRREWAAVRAGAAIVVHPPRTDWCDSRLWRARIARRIPGGIVLPDVDAYPDGQIELVAPVRVRDVLGLHDGDAVTVEIETT